MFKIGRARNTSLNVFLLYTVDLQYMHLQHQFEYKKGLLLRCIHHFFKSDLIYNMDHMRIRVLNLHQ